METLHLAYSAVEDDGINRDVSLLLDSEAEGEPLLALVIPTLQSFLRSCRLIGDEEELETIIRQ